MAIQTSNTNSNKNKVEKPIIKMYPRVTKFKLVEGWENVKFSDKFAYTPLTDEQYQNVLTGNGRSIRRNEIPNRNVTNEILIQLETQGNLPQHLERVK